MVLEYSKHGEIWPDSEAIEFMRRWAWGTFKVSNSALFTAARLLHAQKKIKIDYVLFEGERIEIDEYGKLSSWPEGLCDDEVKMLAEMVRIKKHKRINV